MKPQNTVWNALSYSLGAAWDTSATSHCHATSTICTPCCIQTRWKAVQHALCRTRAHNGGGKGDSQVCSWHLLAWRQLHIEWSSKGCTESLNCSVEVTICRTLVQWLHFEPCRLCHMSFGIQTRLSHSFLTLVFSSFLKADMSCFLPKANVAAYHRPVAGTALCIVWCSIYVCKWCYRCLHSYVRQVE